MKNIILFFSFILFLLTGCENKDEFLNRYPLDAITDVSFWKTPADLELYLNQFYTKFPGFQVGAQQAGIYTIDNNSDNMIPYIYDDILAGTSVIPSSGGGWDWDVIRNINILLHNLDEVKNNYNPSEYNTYVGEGKFFKAYFYFDLLKKFGDLPWISKPLDTDSEALYSTRLSRDIIADSIINLLDDAILLLNNKNEGIPFRINKEAALLFKSRVSLFEGTWEKYHAGTSFGVKEANPNKYFLSCVEAVEDLMEINSTEIYSTGNADSDYSNLFNNDDFSSISEIILWKKFDMDLGMGHSAYLVTSNGHRTGLSRSLVNTYLVSDGLPITESPNYAGEDNLKEVITNRDPRLIQTLFLPGDPISIRDGKIVGEFIQPELSGENRNTTGYDIKKGHRPIKHSNQDFNDDNNASIIFRYAEALLNFAEAKAELGKITQSDIDKSINILRDRVKMPPLILSDIENWNKASFVFRNLSPIINEIRRERRVELAIEGYRFDDIKRWAAADVLITGVNPLGAKFNQENYPDFTIGDDIYVNEDGFIEPYQRSLPNGWQFNINRDYLLPIPTNELTLNKNLEQNPGW